MNFDSFVNATLAPLILAVTLGAGCASSAKSGPAATGERAGVNRRAQIEQGTAKKTDHPSAVPDDPEATNGEAEPYRFNRRRVIQLLYDQGPLVRAGREEMIAARHGLTEFRANLDRRDRGWRSERNVRGRGHAVGGWGERVAGQVRRPR